jgi:hypothetical protein
MQSADCGADVMARYGRAIIDVGQSKLVNITVHMTAMARHMNTMLEASLQFVERTGRVAHAPMTAIVSQPKGPTNVTTRMGMGYESFKFEKQGAALKVMKDIAPPPTR